MRLWYFFQLNPYWPGVVLRQPDDSTCTMLRTVIVRV
jgi:hypothetical protein